MRTMKDRGVKQMLIGIVMLLAAGPIGTLAGVQIMLIWANLLPQSFALMSAMLTTVAVFLFVPGLIVAITGSFWADSSM